MNPLDPLRPALYSKLDTTITLQEDDLELALDVFGGIMDPEYLL